MNTTLERPPLGFTGVLTATKLYGNNWLPEKPIHYQGLWQRFTIPALFITDFASVPRILAWLVIRIGKGARAVILHDYLWRILVPLGTLTYRQADAILRQALREGDADKTLNDTAGDRVPFIQRWLMWTAVRWGALTRPGGRKHWWKDARWSLRKIARHLNLNYSTVREHYLDALAKCGAETHDLTKLPTSLDRHEWRRIEESEFIDARIRDYLDIKERALNEGQLRNAVEALNGAHKYMETLIKLQGISAPERREITITNELLANKLAALEAEVGKVTDAEVVTYEINS